MLCVFSPVAEHLTNCLILFLMYSIIGLIKISFFKAYSQFKLKLKKLKKCFGGSEVLYHLAINYYGTWYVFTFADKQYTVAHPKGVRNNFTDPPPGAL